MRKWYLLALLVVIVAVGCGVKSQLKKLPIISGYSAKALCSYTYIAGLPLEKIESEDLSFGPLPIATNKIQLSDYTATSSVLGLGKKTAVYRQDIGCVLLQGADDYQVQSPKYSRPADRPLPYPYGDATTSDVPAGVDVAGVEAAIAGICDPDGTMTDKKTRAVLVIYKDTIVAEYYADGIDQGTELLGWSMTKSIMNAWVGRQVQAGAVSLEDRNLYEHWQQDARKDISLNDMLHMTSGLEWEEVYDKVSGATTMLFDSEDIVATASVRQAVHPAGDHWYYSSGTSNLISGYLRSKYTEHEDYLRYPYDSLFFKLGMYDTVLESDESGTYIGSSYCYATARDWGRFGLLYLHDGVWNGERLLPEGWVDYSTEEVADSDGIYGAHFWLNKRGSAYPNAPYDTYSANGFQGQRVFIIPSRDLVIVRLGLNEDPGFDDFLKQIVASVPVPS